MMKELRLKKDTISRSYNKEKQELVFESSELGFSPAHFNSFVRIPLVNPIRIVNMDTGNSRMFVFKNYESNNGDVMLWEYKSPDGIILTILND